jgi:predicted nucleic acid-binding protein
MTDPTTGLLDTSVVIDHDVLNPQQLPESTAISAVTLAELAAGPHATTERAERGRRQDRLQWATATWDPLPFDAECARAYGRLFAALKTSGRSPRSRVADLMIAATAMAHGLPVYTRNPDDVISVRSLVRVVRV